MNNRLIPVARISCLICVALVGLVVYMPAQSVTSDLDRLRDVAIKATYSVDVARALTDQVGPRLAGSDLEHAAQEKIASLLREEGLLVTLQPVEVPHWVRGEERAEIVSAGIDQRVPVKLAVSALGGSVSTPPQGLNSELVIVHSFSELESLSNDKVKGKIVLFNVPFDERMTAQGAATNAYGRVSPYRTDGPERAAKLGAVAVLVRSIGISGNRLPHTGVTSYPSPVPAAAIADEDADLCERLAGKGPLVVHLVITSQFLGTTTSHNVIADLVGSDRPNEFVVVAGHLDSWDLGTGAIDDAAGVAIAIGAQHAIKASGLRPRRTIRFIAYTAEEFGAVGGRAYAKSSGALISQHYAAIEADRGSGHSIGFEAKASPEFVAGFDPVTTALEPIGATEFQFVSDTEADISSLAAAGVPCFAPWQDARAYFLIHHTAADTFDKIDQKELVQNTAAVAVLAYALAQSNRSK